MQAGPNQGAADNIDLRAVTGDRWGWEHGSVGKKAYHASVRPEFPAPV